MFQEPRAARLGAKRRLPRRRPAAFAPHENAPQAPRFRGDPARTSSSPIQQRYRLLLRLAGPPPGSPPASTGTSETRPRAQTGQMSISVFDLFSIGIGPSSSHTVGPMRAAAMFAARLKQDGLLAQTTAVRAELFGSLGAQIGPAHEIGFDVSTQLVLHRRRSLPYHANGMILFAYDADGVPLLEKTYYSVVGGFVV